MVGGILLLATATVSASAMAAGPAPSPEVRLPISLSEGLDPSSASDEESMEIVAAIYEGLMRVDAATGTLQLGQAARYELSSDGLTYTFTLREDARWSNGERVTANDFHRAWVRVLTPSTASEIGWLISEEAGVSGAESFQTGWAAKVAGLQVVNERTLIVRLQAANPQFLALLTTPAFMPIHVSEGAETTAHTRLLGEHVTNGAWRVTADSTARQALLRPNPYYHSSATAAPTVGEAKRTRCAMLPQLAARLGTNCQLTTSWDGAMLTAHIPRH